MKPSLNSWQFRCLQLSKFYPPVPGGIETTVRDIASGLQERGWSVEVLCASKNKHTYIDTSPVKVFRAGSLGQFASTSLSPVLLLRLILKRRSYDVVHIHLPNPLANLALWIARPSAKVIVHWHSDIIKQKMLLKLYSPLQSWLLKRADTIICTSKPYALSSPWLQPYLNKTQFIPSCIPDPLINADLQKLKHDAQVIKNQFLGKKIVFSLGRMTYYKGFDVLLLAAVLLPKDVVVLIGGEGELSESLRAQASLLNLTDKVFFLGRVLDADLASYYLAADVFCLPSLVRSEAFGLVMVEAMSYACPVIATNIPGSGVPWVNKDGETGFNVPPGDFKSLANALIRVLDDEELASRLGAAGRRRFEGEFAVSRMIDALESVYGQVCIKPNN